MYTDDKRPLNALCVSRSGSFLLIWSSQSIGLRGDVLLNPGVFLPAHHTESDLVRSAIGGFLIPTRSAPGTAPKSPNWFATELLTFLPTHHKLHQAPFCLTMSTPTFLPHYRCSPSACPMQSPFSATTVVSGNMLSKLSSQWAKQSDSRSITVSRPIPPLYPVEWRR